MPERASSDAAILKQRLTKVHLKILLIVNTSKELVSTIWNG